MPGDISTPWGKATLVDEVRVQQRAGDKRFSSIVQLLEARDGEPLIRFAYATTVRLDAAPSRCELAISRSCERRYASVPN